jgi:hypothetical protein
MDEGTPQSRMLYCALEDYGGEVALAEALEVSVEVLTRWLSADDVMPAKIYFAVLDLVAQGRFDKGSQSNSLEDSRSDAGPSE